ncbi:MAG: chromosome segregation protein SMC [Nitrosomonas sp.]|nr:chromosome segregation protein SMC [Nitrosomonas sp.]
MRLSEIKLSGFKSFVDPTVIPLPGNLVGIVGPNGCGKSNVIDAVRWVLGESRASALRGESLQDVIFNGSAKRAPVGRASVELIFDNSAGKLAGQWGKYGQIAIRRVMQKAGESTYHINNIHVRRRDIADIFLGTGVSGRGYAIIEQGMISRVIEAKPQELRAFLEEAAGISRYRERRHESELRLSDARGNLSRLDDVVAELGKQAQHLRAQAEVAARYHELQAQRLAAQRMLCTQQKQQATAARAKAQTEIERHAANLDALRIRQQTAEQALETLRASHKTAGDQQLALQGKLYETDGEIARIDQQLQNMRDNQARLSQQLAESAHRLQDYEARLKNVQVDSGAFQTQLQQAEALHADLQHQLGLEHGQLPLLEAAANTDQTQLTTVRENLLAVQHSEELQQHQLAHTDKTLQRLLSRQDGLQREQQQQPAVDHAALAGLQQQAHELLALLTQKKQTLTDLEAQLEGAQREKAALEDQTHAWQQEMTQISAQHDALQRLQHQTGHDQEMDAWVSRNQLDVLPRLWQQIRIETGWETALESVLHARIEAVGIDRLDHVLTWEQRYPPGKWTVCEKMVPRGQEPVSTQISPAGRPDWQPLAKRLHYHDPALQPALETWLAGIFTTHNIESGLADRAHLAAGEWLVTAEGHILGRYSLSYFAPDSALYGVLARQQEIERLAVEQGEIERNYLLSQQVLSQAQVHCRDLATSIAQMRNDIEQGRVKHHEQQLQMMQLAQQHERITQRGQQLDSELGELAQQIAQELSQKEQVESRLAACRIEQSALAAQVRQAQSMFQQSSQALAAQRARIQQTENQLREAAFNEKYFQGKCADCERQIAQIGHDITVLAQDCQQLEQTQTGFDPSVLLVDLAQWQAQRLQHELSLAAIRETLTAVDDSLGERGQARMQAEQDYHAASEALGQARLRAQEAEINERQFADKLRELGVDDVPLTAQSVSNQSPARQQARIDRITGDIAALGAVNLAALDELEVLQEREETLVAQLQDLEEAIQALEQAIRQIDGETRERLATTFTEVNRNLAELFSSVFGGGQAELLFSGDDILQAGIQLTAHPPGKKNSSIQLLSGGEKALTALALVFALFKLNPAPFCLLDEVDAPLDDSNAGRFCELVRRMAQDTQFLFISHNKTTMQMAQQLIGVTMHEQGVSRVVTVDMEKMTMAETETTPV